MSKAGAFSIAADNRPVPGCPMEAIREEADFAAIPQMVEALLK